MTMNESAENYLETILILSKSHPVVRSVDVANQLDFKKSSVSVAMKKLRENNHIIVSSEGFITLTESGLKIAESIYERHEVISTWLIDLGVTEEVAIDDACRIEHVISAESFAALKKHIRGGK
ncbi:MAG: metal-dependent transcriptional regulator [Eubacteriales bacterium]|nr:metal-dependent transcriptional regulator [Eubacteriales bacterium]